MFTFLKFIITFIQKSIFQKRLGLDQAKKSASQIIGILLTPDKIGVFLSLHHLCFSKMGKKQQLQTSHFVRGSMIYFFHFGKFSFLLFILFYLILSIIITFYFCYFYLCIYLFRSHFILFLVNPITHFTIYLGPTS